MLILIKYKNDIIICYMMLYDILYVFIKLNVYYLENITVSRKSPISCLPLCNP